MTNKNKKQAFNSKVKGIETEQRACTYLQHQGLELVAQNISSRYGEIDLIMREGDTLVFVEVRYRKNNHFGGAAASITLSKQKKIIKTASIYQQKYAPNDGIRFDVIAVEGGGSILNWIKSAFDGF